MVAIAMLLFLYSESIADLNYHSGYADINREYLSGCAKLNIFRSDSSLAITITV